MSSSADEPYSLNLGQPQQPYYYGNQPSNQQRVPVQKLDFYSSQDSYQHQPGYDQPFPQNADLGNEIYLGSTSIWTAFGTCGFSNEPPLLEELGINFGYIKSKSLAVLNPFSQIRSDIMDDPDLSGPLIIGLLLMLSMILNGKYQLGYVYGIGLVGCLGTHLILNFMCTEGTTAYKTASVLGYCLLPMNLLGFINSLYKLNENFVGASLTSFVVMWCTYSASTIFVKILRMHEQKLLVGYPILLLYTCFSLIIIY